jgi:hypothetical protein
MKKRRKREEKEACKESGFFEHRFLSRKKIFPAKQEGGVDLSLPRPRLLHLA